MNHIDLKAWKDYTHDEKVELLLHWWHYYGKMLITNRELQKFTSLANENPDLIWNTAVLSFQSRKSSQDIISAMRNETLDVYLNQIKIRMSNLSAENLLAFSDSEYSLLSQTVKTYNDPEPDVPMSRAELLTQLMNMMLERPESSKKHHLKKLPEKLPE